MFGLTVYVVQVYNPDGHHCSCLVSLASHDASTASEGDVTPGLVCHFLVALLQRSLVFLFFPFLKEEGE